MCGLKNNDSELQTLQDKDMILLLENTIRGGISSVMGDRYVKLDENKKIMYIDPNILYGQSMSQPLLYDEIKVDKKITIEDILNTAHDSDIGYLMEADIKDPDKNIKEKTKSFLFAPEINHNITPHMIKMKPNSYTRSKKLI